jgi:hypothetical protein
MLCMLLGFAAQAISPSVAAAHFGPAEPPDFGMPQCITVVDLRTSRELMLPYDLGYDDTEPEFGHIMISDSKTHQFFAFRGAVVPALPRYYYWSFTPGARTNLPLWLDSDDLQRADAANDPSIAPDFRAVDIGNNLLVARTDVAGQWLEVSQKVPITIEQAMKGTRWDLTGVSPGIYQIISYTFSPPFNAWEPRPGVIKIIDGSADAPALTVDSIDGMLYAGQGRRITGCVDAPPGSTLSAWYSTESESEPEWREWRKDVPVDNGQLDLCFSSPDPQLSGLIRLRIGVKTPQGLETHAHSPDVLVLVSTPSACSPGDSDCCQPPPAQAPAPPQPTAAGAAAPPPAPTPAPAMQPIAASRGCAVERVAQPDRARSLAWLLTLLLAAATRRRRTRPRFTA